MARNTYPLVQETSTLSADGRSWLRVMVWLPDPVYSRRGIVQLVHGMAEHIERYDSFARFLAGLGYVVFGHDHIGHGKSVSSADELGCMPLQGGKDILVADVLRAREAAFKASRETGALPLFLFGHSMGSLWCVPASPATRRALRALCCVEQAISLVHFPCWAVRFRVRLVPCAGKRIALACLIR